MYGGLSNGWLVGKDKKTFGFLKPFACCLVAELVGTQVLQMGWSASLFHVPNGFAYQVRWWPLKIFLPRVVIG